MNNWELTLVSLAFIPVVCVSFASVGFAVRKLAAQERAAYARANGIAGEVFSAIKTIFAFEGQKRELRRYSGELLEAERVELKRSVIFSFSKNFVVFYNVLFRLHFCWYSTVIHLREQLSQTCDPTNKRPMKLHST